MPTLSKRPQIHVIPDTHYIVYYGDHAEAESYTLRGVVRLETAEAISIKGVRVRLEAKKRIGWYDAQPIGGEETYFKTTTVVAEKELGTSGTHKVRDGVTEWSFELKLDANLPESIEGYQDSWLIYTLHAEIERPMWNQKRLRDRKHIRVVRTLALDNMSVPTSRAHEDIWANKISYSVAIPQATIVFGTSIIVNISISPLRKGITFGAVELILKENAHKIFSATPDCRCLGKYVTDDEVEVANTTIKFPSDAMIVFDGETVENPIMEDERYRFSLRLPLPKSLQKCRQDVEDPSIRITHKLKVTVNIINPEGHKSQLNCTMPIRLFISPNLPIGNSSEVDSSGNHLSEEQLNNRGDDAAPPLYAHHQLDELFEDVQISGYQTAIPSGMTSPMGPLSRTGSTDNLLMLRHTVPLDHEINSAALRTRLSSLYEDPNHSNPSHRQILAATNASGVSNMLRNLSIPEMMDQSVDPSTPATPPRRVASDSQAGHIATTDDQGDLAIHHLTRTPSYTTALRDVTPLTPIDDHPPSYAAATSHPPSPRGSISGSSTHPSSQSHSNTVSPKTSRQSLVNRTRVDTLASRHDGPVLRHAISALMESLPSSPTTATSPADTLRRQSLPRLDTRRSSITTVTASAASSATLRGSPNPDLHHDH